MKRWLVRNGTQAVIGTLAALARVSGPRQASAQRLIEAFGAMVAAARGVRDEDRTPAELGATWQKAFGAKKHVPIVRLDERVAYGEILTPCPLRGSGDVEACYRMMGYDRAFMARAGAEFVVLRSQAEPGVTSCHVAIHRRTKAVSPLEPAHLRIRRPG